MSSSVKSSPCLKAISACSMIVWPSELPCNFLIMNLQYYIVFKILNLLRHLYYKIYIIYKIFLQCTQPALQENAAHRFCQQTWHHKKNPGNKEQKKIPVWNWTLLISEKKPIYVKDKTTNLPTERRKCCESCREEICQSTNDFDKSMQEQTCTEL